jgi:threonyl-tRNA synthetase
MIKITFPDGGVREYESGVTPLQVAESISSRLAQDILCASILESKVESRKTAAEPLKEERLF